MPLSLVQIKAGIVKDITPYAAGKAGPFWVDGNNIRFKNGYAEKIGGWQNEDIYGTDASNNADYDTVIALQGVPREINFWRGLGGVDRMAVGTHNHLYIIENQAAYDITPIRDTSGQTTTLDEALDTSETSIDLTSATGFPTAGAIKIETEIITYTNISSNTLTGCTRGTNSTSAATHADGTDVTRVLINPITTVDESNTITITDNAHGASDGDFVVISGAAATGGVTANNLNRSAGYEITLVTANSYTIQSPTEATSGVTGGGLVVVLSYLIGLADGLGSQTASAAFGWGSGGWGESTWGTPRSESVTGVVVEQSQWSLRLWGEDLIATVRNHNIYYWDTSVGVGSRAVLTSSLGGASAVPVKNRVSIVSFPDRHLVSGGVATFGGDVLDPMLVRWSDQEDFVDWTPSITNTSGDQRLEIGTKIVAMMPTREEVFISTDEAVYGMSFIGPPFTFSFRLVGTNCGTVGINTMMNVDGKIFWMGKSDFFIYEGSVREIPCPVKFYVTDRINKDELDKCFAAHNKEFNEVTWFYVSTDNTATDGNPEPDSYVSYNYSDNAWSIGTIDRTCWFDSFGFRKVPFAFSKEGYLYNQETGADADGAALGAHVETSQVEVSQTGNDLMLVDKIIPDLTVSGTLSCTIFSKKYPNDSTTTKGPFTISQGTTKISMRSRGRQMSMKLESTDVGDSWSLGDFRFNSREDGLR